jgi:hypothetical protein
MIQTLYEPCIINQRINGLFNSNGIPAKSTEKTLFKTNSCLLAGKGGSKIRELQDNSGARIKVR